MLLAPMPIELSRSPKSRTRARASQHCVKVDQKGEGGFFFSGGVGSRGFESHKIHFSGGLSYQQERSEYFLSLVPETCKPR